MARTALWVPHRRQLILCRSVGADIEAAAGIWSESRLTKRKQDRDDRVEKANRGDSDDRNSELVWERKFYSKDTKASPEDKGHVIETLWPGPVLCRENGEFVAYIVAQREGNRLEVLMVDGTGKISSNALVRSEHEIQGVRLYDIQTLAVFHGQACVSVFSLNGRQPQCEVYHGTKTPHILFPVAECDLFTCPSSDFLGDTVLQRVACSATNQVFVEPAAGDGVTTKDLQQHILWKSDMMLPLSEDSTQSRNVVATNCECNASPQHLVALLMGGHVEVRLNAEHWVRTENVQAIIAGAFVEKHCCCQIAIIHEPKKEVILNQNEETCEFKMQILYVTSACEKGQIKRIVKWITGYGLSLQLEPDIESQRTRPQTLGATGTAARRMALESLKNQISIAESVLATKATFVDHKRDLVENLEISILNSGDFTDSVYSDHLSKFLEPLFPKLKPSATKQNNTMNNPEATDPGSTRPAIVKCIGMYRNQLRIDIVLSGKQSNASAIINGIRGQCETYPLRKTKSVVSDEEHEFMLILHEVSSYQTDLFQDLKVCICSWESSHPAKLTWTREYSASKDPGIFLDLDRRSWHDQLEANLLLYEYWKLALSTSSTSKSDINTFLHHTVRCEYVNSTTIELQAAHYSDLAQAVAKLKLSIDPSRNIVVSPGADSKACLELIRRLVESVVSEVRCVQDTGNSPQSKSREICLMQLNTDRIAICIANALKLACYAPGHSE